MIFPKKIMDAIVESDVISVEWSNTEIGKWPSIPIKESEAFNRVL